MSKPGRNDACPCGSGKKYKHCCLTADQARDAREQPPADPAQVHALAVQAALAHHQAGRLAEAEDIYRDILRADPAQPDALHLLGLIAHQTGQHEAALTLMTRAVALQPDHQGAHTNRALVLKALGRLDESADAFRTALALDPGSAEGHFNLALALHRLGRLADAIAHYRLALQHRPAYAEALNNQGVALRDLGQAHAALHCFRQALQHQPGYADAHNNLGLALVDQGQPLQAIDHYRQAIQANPRLPEPCSNLGVVLQDLGHLADAEACYRQAEALGSAGARVRRALMLPPIMGTRPEMLALRQAHAQQLEALIASGLRLDDPLREVGVTSFYLAFHGMNDRDLQARTAAFYEQACPALTEVAPHCAAPEPLNGRRLRVGFVSKFIFNHSVSKCFGKIISELTRRDAFDIFLLSSAEVGEAEYRCNYAGFDGARVRLPPDLRGSRDTIAGLALDVLMYMDIGMDPHSYFLAFARLAPLQCVMGGHPVTSGIRNLDLFLTAQTMEAPEAAAHYTEGLVHFPTGVFYFDRPAPSAPLKSRQELGLPETGALYMCPMKLQKLHPDFDVAMGRILQADPHGRIVLFEDHRYPTWREQLQRRFEQTLPAAVRHRVVFRPWLSDYGDFISANAAADVVLDPFHFGIGSTLIATFAVGTPIVTLPGEFLRGRGGMGFCRMMGLDECIVDTEDAYVERAVRFANDLAFRAGVKARILARNGVFFENLQPAQDLADFLLSRQLPP
jgi:protein O-GlcNAc transferase